MALLVALILALSFPFIANAQCTTAALVRVGGQIHVDAAPITTFLQTGKVATFIDLNRPATAHVAAESALLQYEFFGSQVTVRFASLTPSGRTYSVRNATAPIQITASGGSSTFAEVHQVALDPPLVFEPGDVLGVVVTPGAGLPPSLILARSEGWAGTVAVADDVAQTGSVSLDSGVFPISRSLVGAFVSGPVNCSQVPSPQVILPVTGDVTGRVHYTTDVGVYISSSLATANFWPVEWTIRDRLRNANAATVLSGSATASRKGPFVGDSIGVLSSLPSQYLGPMIVSIPGASFIYSFSPTARFSDDVIATARVTAQGPAGDAGSSEEAVSCNRIGHVVAVPFHRTANQRVNIGIASAQLNSCGVFAPAKAVFVTVNGGNQVGIAMPAESAQLDDITGDTSALADAKGLTEGVIRISVLDEASRVVAYSSVVDNTSQAATITIGRVER